MIVYTSIVGEKDNLREQAAPGKYVAFTEHQVFSETWEQRPAYNRFTSPRRNSRAPKILAHKFLDTRYSLWLDGNLQLLVPLPLLVDTYLKEHDIALFAHPTRGCLYDEAMECAKLRLDDPEIIIEQAKHYEDDGFGKQRGLCEGMFILRRHTARVEAFNNYWWSEYCRYSVRDQISMPYALDKAGLVPNVIPEQFENHGGVWTRGGIIEIVSHLTPRIEL